MLFNSFEFIVFFLVVLGSYYALPHRLRWPLLLLASCFFYMYFIPEYILILLCTILITYGSGILMERTDKRNYRKNILIVSMMLNVFILAYFKYFTFLHDNLTAVLGLVSAENRLPLMQIMLPVGLSFFVFQSISYSIEVYRGTLDAERHLGFYALYVMYFPQLVAGPIERPQNIIPQLKKDAKFSLGNLEAGLKLILLGLFKKVVVADQLSLYVDNVYGTELYQSPEQIFAAAMLFSFQIYCDFSGYSDMAIGLARAMGIKLMINFRQPYFSYSLTNFWQRWHISLSSWFKDYLYIPLGGNRGSKYNTYRNILIIFAVSGLWHGASWTFVLWGLIHGFIVALERFTNYNPRRKGYFCSFVGGLTTFFIVTFAWIFFRAVDVNQAFHFVSLLPSISAEQTLMLFSHPAMLYNICLVCLLIFIDFYFTRITVDKFSTVVKTIFYTLIALFIIIMGSFNSSSFIYFQF